MILRTIYVFLACCGLAAQSRPLPRAVLPKDSIAVDPTQHEVTRVVVKLAENTPGLMAAGAIADPGVRAVIGARASRPLFAGLDRELGEIRARVVAATPASETLPADLSLYFEVRAADLGDARALVRRLNALPQVELAYPRELPAPPPGDILPVTPGFVAGQAYRGPAPDGLDALAIQQLTGARGRGITVLEIEWGWWFDHEDLAVLRPSSLIGPPGIDTTYNTHGVAVIGEMAADHDQYGVSGLTPEISVLVASDNTANGYSVAAAIVAGLPRLRAGDVMLVAAQTLSPVGLVPTEWNQADFDAIQNATRLGVITVEAGANGGVDLDDRRLHDAFDLSRRDSGAIVVGASEGRARVRASFSSYGSRIDANGWGRDVVTTGYGDLFAPFNDRRQQYTAMFAGTSSASPMVTSAVVALLGGARAQLAPEQARDLDYRAVRELLRTHGTSMDRRARIGLRPDMRKLLRAAHLDRGLRVLDEPKIGRIARLQLAPPDGTPEVWIMLGALQPANIGLGGLFPAPYCNRLLLDPAGTILLALGRVTALPVELPVYVPNEPTLRGGAFYLQAMTLQRDRGPCLTNSVMLLIER